MAVPELDRSAEIDAELARLAGAEENRAWVRAKLAERYPAYAAALALAEASFQCSHCICGQAAELVGAAV